MLNITSGIEEMIKRGEELIKNKKISENDYVKFYFDSENILKYAYQYNLKLGDYIEKIIKNFFDSSKDSQINIILGILKTTSDAINIFMLVNIAMIALATFLYATECKILCSFLCLGSDLLISNCPCYQ